ncbi:ATP-binding protein [Candidatus Babeliales bacterium]|nr:ATP-binding protein [Candidatus Babeliales bacterium]MCF7899098.1 ATP-binding protein [Candidatus Babeliales bacterium]
MIKRDLTEHLIESAKQFAAVAVTGPRQSGKTTLVQEVFKKHNYVSLEDFDKRAQAIADPRLFLQNYSNEFGIILDEIQHVPELLSYIQTIIDREKKKGYFIITGSQNLLINQSVSQTLAGRIALLTLFPLAINELNNSSLLSGDLKDFVFKGCYPRIYDENVSPVKLHEYYIRGYVERDVRQIKNIFDLNLFQTFLKLCAGRIGQILNISALSNDCGIDQKTVNAWISLLEATHIIFLLNPYYKNFGKRLVKSPKIYFVDTGIACSLLNIKNTNELSSHYNWGGLVESFIISDLFKQYYNLNQKPSLYFWRDHQGNEIDVILEQALNLIPIEIKAGKTINMDVFKHFLYLKNIENFPVNKKFVIYGGSENQDWPEAKVLGWKNFGTLVKSIN